MEGGGGARSGSQALGFSTGSCYCFLTDFQGETCELVFSLTSPSIQVLSVGPLPQPLNPSPPLLTAFLSPELFRKGVKGPGQGSTMTPHGSAAFSSWHWGASRHPGYGVQS